MHIASLRTTALAPFMSEALLGNRDHSKKETDQMSNIIDKVLGRTKKAAGDLTGDASLRREGTKDEKKGEAKDKLDNAKEAVQDKAEEVADLEKKG
jgi:uncharacterized protein YjbJ (UPF0337 family)